MRVLVTKPFAYSSTGLTVTNQFVAGDEPDLHDACIDGLLSEGFITVGLPPAEQGVRVEEFVKTVADLKDAVAKLRSEVEAPSDGIAIPEDWRQIKWFGLKSLAQKIAGRDVVDANDARAIVEAEIAKRTA